MTERCGACGTDGVTNSMGRFVSRDWLRASELSAECDRLRKIEAAARNLCTVKGRHHSLSGCRMSQPAPRGTIALLAFAETLPKRAENLRGFFDYNAAAADIMRCKEIIERLAQFEPDIEVEPGEN